jgi:DNA mismatch repair ATPase MutS
LVDLRQRIDKSIVPEPPISLSDGGVMRSGVDPELDQLRDLSRNSKQFLAQIELRERQRTGITSLKVKFNNIFGYYLEISKPNLHLAPADYERKQTLVNAERFTTPELKEYESKILDAQEKIVEIERRLFAELRSAIAGEARRIRQTALALAEVDVLAALAHIAALRNYCRPKFDGSADLEILEGRHPVIEQQEMGGGVVFLRKVEPGAADRSYGIEVAKLAGLPHEVIARAREVLAEHETAELRLSAQLAGDEQHPRPAAQLTIFTPLSQPVLERLREVDLDRLTPLEALNLLAELKKQVE